MFRRRQKEAATNAGDTGRYRHEPDELQRKLDRIYAQIIGGVIPQLEVIEHLIRRLHRMAVDQATFDTALADFLNAQASLLAEVDVAVQAILAKVPDTIDLTAELDQITNAKQAATDATTALSNAVTPTPPA